MLKTVTFICMQLWRRWSNNNSNSNHNYLYNTMSRNLLYIIQLERRIFYSRIYTCLVERHAYRCRSSLEPERKRANGLHKPVQGMNVNGVNTFPEKHWLSLPQPFGRSSVSRNNIYASTRAPVQRACLLKEENAVIRGTTWYTHRSSYLVTRYN